MHFCYASQEVIRVIIGGSHPLARTSAVASPTAHFGFGTLAQERVARLTRIGLLFGLQFPKGLGVYAAFQAW